MVEKIFHSVVVNVFIKEEDNFEQVEQVFLNLFPFDLIKEKIIYEKTEALITEERKLNILKVILNRNRNMNDFMKSIKEKISIEDKNLLVEQLNSRIDEDLNFFFRINKDKLLKEGIFQLTDTGNCFHFKCHVATYPQNLEKAKEKIKLFFQD